jgi:hypothetical protein
MERDIKKDWTGIKLLGFAGSLRSGSYNKAFLRAALELTPQGVSLEIFDLEGIPPFNQDLEKDSPERVRTFKQKIRQADGLLTTNTSSILGPSGPIPACSDDRRRGPRPEDDHLLRRVRQSFKSVLTDQPYPGSPF